jgi:hypothetical protein
MKRSLWLAVLGAAGVLAGAEPRSATPTTQRLTPAHFAEVQKLIKPSAKEDRWAEVPWLTSLTQARKEAAARGKPILLWEMDGHPLGCT